MNLPTQHPAVPTPGPISLRMIEELRDALLQLAQALRDLEFECDPQARQRAQQHLDACLQRIQAQTRGPV